MSRPTPLFDQVLDTLKGAELAPFGHERGVYWVMSKLRAELIAKEAGVGLISMRGTRLLGIPILFSESVPDPILAWDSPDADADE